MKEGDGKIWSLLSRVKSIHGKFWGVRDGIRGLLRGGVRQGRQGRQSMQEVLDCLFWCLLMPAAHLVGVLSL